ncbi:hypothetical protein QBC41DRAFT_124602 [Cercophora samala]|uniref:Uncharacterized protein n=1 Tax=Cercophora samala TaxID=330535 RepID=A0AA40D9N0_9PEZI|nr:hypothetical protein QBC41DRAFT_124602 [Cercophora samala]
MSILPHLQHIFTTHIVILYTISQYCYGKHRSGRKIARRGRESLGILLGLELADALPLFLILLEWPWILLVGGPKTQQGFFPMDGRMYFYTSLGTLKRKVSGVGVWISRLCFVFGHRFSLFFPFLVSTFKLQITEH